jgi:hypothetical protein
MLWTAPPPAASALRDFSGNRPNTPQEFADFASFLPPTRSPNCSHEYQTLVRAFRQEISPHIDQELARVVLDTDWLDQVEAKPLPQK